MNEQLAFAGDAPPQAATGLPWTLLVVDDDPEVHAVTRLMLTHARIEGRALELLHAHSAAEAKPMLARHGDIALVLLDVVMETEHAGLDLAQYVRDQLGNDAVRIVLRTGQPGQAPAHDVVARYNIDDYVAKSELTFERLQILVTTALRTYAQLRHLQRIAHADALTGLPNRRRLEQQVYGAWEDLARADTRLVALMVDLDRFKDYNDANGHPAGDRVLLEVARVLSMNVTGEAWVGRHGGEEFLVLMRGATMTQGVELGERLREAVAQLRLPHPRAPQGVVTVSVGVAGIEPRLHAMDAGYPQLIKDADRALLRAKRAGRNRVEAGLPGIA
ncbi:MAG: diguanylate cyclase [Nevskiaceae bacterium]